MMSIDADKIAAATVTAALLQQVSGASDDQGKITKAVELYGKVLAQIIRINPDTGKPFTQEEIQRFRMRGG